MKKFYAIILCAVIFPLLAASGCDDGAPTSDQTQRQQQEKILKEGSAEVGMPAIKNFRERKMLKDILELRDQNGLTTYTYLYNELNGKLQFLGETIGYGIPYATEFTNPLKPDRNNYYSGGGAVAVSQADPNGLFAPASAEGTWILLKNPNGKDVQPVYVETRIIVSPFKLALQ